MIDLKCNKCGETATYADAQDADKRNTCGPKELVKDTALGAKYDGTEHEWERTND